MNRIKALQIIPSLKGGIGSVLLNFCSRLDSGKIQIDFGVFIDDDKARKKLVEKTIGRVYVLPRMSRDYGQYKRTLEQLISENKYDIVHAHQNSMSFIPLGIAKAQGVHGRIMHSHATDFEGGSKMKNMISKIINRLKMNSVANVRLACGKKAGEFLYGKRAMRKGNVIVLPNAIDIEKFRFDLAARERMRTMFGFGDDEKVLLFVGRLVEIKNIPLCLDIIKRCDDKTKLVICGSGDKEQLLKEKCVSEGITSKVLFVGERADVAAMYCMADAFLLTSFAEGFPMTIVEALASGLPCFISDTITDEFCDYEAVEYCPLQDADYWVEALKALPLGKRYDMINRLNDKKLNIETAAEMLSQIYEEAVKGISVTAKQMESK